MSSFRIALLMTCHNRCEATLTCLRSVFEQKLADGSDLVVFLVDDGSTDGTRQCVRENFPEVHVIEGDGNLYWNQGMRLAWQSAAEVHDWDAYLWLNDDTMLLPGALKTLLETSDMQVEATGQRGIVVGSCRAPSDPEEDHPSVLTYGGRREKGLVEPTMAPQEILAFNGNLVLVAREAFQKLGNLNPAYRHAYGDIDYGILARKINIPIWLAPGYLAECPRNGLLPWRDPEVPFPQRWKSFRGVKGISIREIKAMQKTRGRGNWLFTLCTQLGYVLFPNIRNKINAWRYGK